MPKAKGRFQKERRLKEMSAPPEPSASETTDPSEEPVTTSTFPVPLSDEDRMVVRLTTGQWDQIVDFAIMQQVLVEGKWRDVVRYDCAHGRVHAHAFRFGRDDPVKEWDLRGCDDLEDGYKRAWGVILSEWQASHRRYFRDG